VRGVRRISGPPRRRFRRAQPKPDWGLKRPKALAPRIATKAPTARSCLDSADHAGTESLPTRRWREPDSNPRSRHPTALVAAHIRPIIVPTPRRSSAAALADGFVPLESDRRHCRIRLHRCLTRACTLPQGRSDSRKSPAHPSTICRHRNPKGGVVASAWSLQAFAAECSPFAARKGSRVTTTRRHARS
jgi:hypothetical protein